MRNISLNWLQSVFLTAAFLISVLSLAQTHEIKGRVVDNENGKPIEGVVITNTKNNSYTITNEDGNFLMTVALDEELLFNHINYEMQQLVAEKSMEVVLRFINTELEEILVFNRPLHEVFGAALKGAKKTINKGDLYKTYVREFNIVNENQVNVAEGLVDFYFKKGTQRPLTDVVEHRVFKSAKDMDADAELEEALGVVGGDVRDGLRNSVNLDLIERILKNTDSYELLTRKKAALNGAEKIVVAFEPKAGLKEWRYEQGYVVFNASLTKVLEYNYKLADAYKDKSKTYNLILAKVQVHDYGKHVVFLDHATAYRVQYCTSFMDASISSKKHGKHRLHVLNELLVDDLIKNVEIPKQKQFKGTLFKEKSNYKTEFWKNRNMRPLSVKEQKILNQLEEIKN